VNAPLKVQRHTSRLKALLARKRAAILPGTPNALFARVIEVHDGPQAAHEVLERVTGAAAGQLRVLHDSLARRGLGPREPLPAALDDLRPPSRPW